MSAPSRLDRNAASQIRLRRNQQKAATGSSTDSIVVSPPIANTGGTISLSIATAGGIFNSGGLSLKLADTSLSIAAGGASVKLATSSALAVSSGLKVAVDGSSITINGSNQLAALTGAGSPLTTKGDLYTFSTVNTRIGVGSNGNFLVAASGQATGLQWIAGNSDTSLAGSATGLAVALATNSGLTVSAGVKLLLADTSLSLGVSGVQANLNGSGGLQTSSGLGVKLDTNPGLVLSATGLKILLNPTNPGLTLAAAGMSIVANNKGIALSGGGIGVQLNTGTCIFISGVGSGGLDLQLGDTSLQVSAGSLSVKPATSGGLSVSTGLLVRGLRLSAGNPTGLADGDTWYDSTAKGPRQQNDGIVQSASGLIATNIADSTTLASVTGLTFFDVTQAVPAAYFTAGKTYRIRAIGTYSYTGAPTVSFALQLTNAGGTVQVSTPTFTPTGSVGGRWFMEMVTTCRSTGAAGVFSRMGFQYVETGGLAGTNTLYPSGGTTQTTDTTSLLTVKAGVNFSVSNASNNAVLHMLTVEPLN